MGEQFIDKNHPVLAFVPELAAPLHDRCIRDRERCCRAGEASLSVGVRLRTSPVVRKALATALADFGRFMTVAMAAKPTAKAFPVILEVGRIAGVGRPESYRIDTTTHQCRITATDVEGLRRALVYLEDEMSLRRAPLLPVGETVRECFVKARISRSPYAPYRFGTGWELETDEDCYPDEYLNRLAHAGINAIWVAGFFQNLIATKTLPELGPQKTRLGRLRRLVERAARYGIKVYFFCMEPRIVLDQSIFRKYPDIRGTQFPLSCSLGETALCTSTPRVRAYVREAFGELFRAAPGLAGVIDIFAGERATSCWWTADIVKGCPRCSQRSQGAVLAELLNTIHAGMKAVAPDAELLAWDYSSVSTETKREVLVTADRDIVWLGCFEHGGRTTLCGKRMTMDEYSLSYVGPSEPFRALARSARKLGKRMYAKLQIGTTYEQSSLPYVPVPSSVFRKFRAMERLEVSGAMVSWIIGGFPSFMLKAAGEASFLPAPSEPAFLRRLAAIEWGEQLARTVARAWSRFFAAYRLYPAMNAVFYYGPITRCPAYHLLLDREPRRADPYNWGITTTREIQPFEDDPQRWFGGFTAEELIAAFRLMAERWNAGLELLEKATAGSGELFARRQLGVARAAWIQFRSCANVIEFYTLRNANAWCNRETGRGVRARMRDLALDDIALARQMRDLLEYDPSLGFESEMRYYSVSVPLLDAKIRQTQGILRRL